MTAPDMPPSPSDPSGSTVRPDDYERSLDDGPPPPSHAPQGVRLLVAGAILAVLAPLAGFLGGSMVGQDAAVAGLTPLYLWLFAGLVVGGIGGILAIMGALTWARHRAEYQAERSDQLRAAQQQRHGPAETPEPT